MARFEVETSEEDDRVRVTLAGECDLSVCARLSEALLAAVGRARIVVVDLGGLAFLDSSGVHGLVTAHHAALDRGGRVYAVNQRGAVAALLEVTGIADLLSPEAGR